MGNCIACFIENDAFANVDNVDFLSFDGYKTTAKVVYVYDGDTVHLVLPLRETRRLIKIKTRLYGIDTPELRIKEQKEQALVAKNKLIELLAETNYMVNVECGKFDKYGRVLVTLYSTKHEKSLNQILVDNGCAYEYFGKTKKNYDASL